MNVMDEKKIFVMYHSNLIRALQFQWACFEIPSGVNALEFEARERVRNSAVIALNHVTNCEPPVSLSQSGRIRTCLR